MISVIIPTLNEAAKLPGLLTRLSDTHEVYEVIISDGGSDDDTIDVAMTWGARCESGSRGRGQQLMRGAETAQGDILLFLHADTELPPNALSQIRDALKSPDVIGGNFALGFDGGTDFATWLNDYYVWLRSNGFYYGDSAIFIRRGVYDALGGIRPICLMEDYDFVRRMERVGSTVCLDHPGAMTSSRRFQGRKPWRIFWQWVYLHVLFHLRVPSSVLAKLYRSEDQIPGDDRRMADY